MRLFLIINPVAGRRRPSRLAGTITALQQGGVELALRETMQRGDARALAQQAVAEGYDRVVVAGGDGTINEAINGLAGSAIPMGIIPLGTANVLAAEIGLSGDASEIAATILSGWSRPISLGRLTTASGAHRFAMMAGIGFDARVVACINPALKRLTGKFAYVVASIDQVLRGPDEYFKLVIDGRPYRAASAIVAKGHYYGGRFVACPLARLNDPSFQVCLFGQTGRWNVLRYASALATGRLGSLSDVAVVPAYNIRIEGPEGEPLQLDGDCDGGIPADISIEPDAINLLYPRPC